jgi:ATP-binding cassette subfamily F protein 3
MIMAKDNNMLLLDEPTNHLDMPSRESLESALKNYSGTIFFVSHDRYFVNSVADYIVELEDCKLTVYAGNYDDFIKNKNAKVAVKPQREVPTTTFRSAKQRAEQTNKARKIKELEQQISALEEQIEIANNEMTKNEVVSDYTKLSEVMKRQQELTEQLNLVMAEWESLIE